MYVLLCFTSLLVNFLCIQNYFSFQFVEESYDIPRSHHLPYYNLNNNSSGNDNNANSPTLSINKDDSLLSEGAACSTPIKHPQKMSTLQKNTRHFYTNAAPTKVEGNVFRYDFDDNVNEISPLISYKIFIYCFLFN